MSKGYKPNLEPTPQFQAQIQQKHHTALYDEQPPLTAFQPEKIIYVEVF